LNPTVALVKGEHRYENVRRALELVEGEVDLSRARDVLLKPNFISVTKQLAATHVDAVRAVLNFVRERTSAPLVIAESSGSGAAEAAVGFRNFGYHALAQRYGAQLVDLNREAFVRAEILDWSLRPIGIRLARRILDSDCRISICPPKTHDCLIITAAVKNMVMGSMLRKENRLLAAAMGLASRLVGDSSQFGGRVPTWVGRFSGNDKLLMHQGYKVMNLNLCKVAKLVLPHLAVIDGLEGMEGNGPVEGDRVDFGIAIASTNAVAADSLVAELMGFASSQIGYLYYCHQAGLGQGDVRQMKVVGEVMDSCFRPFRPHPAYEAALGWRFPGAKDYL